MFKNIQDPDKIDDVEMQIELLQHTVSEAKQNISNFKAQVNHAKIDLKTKKDT